MRAGIIGFSPFGALPAHARLSTGVCDLPKENIYRMKGWMDGWMGDGGWVDSVWTRVGGGESVCLDGKADGWLDEGLEPCTHENTLGT